MSSCNAFQRVLVPLQVFLKLSLVVIAEVISEIVVNPAAVAADGLPVSQEVMDPLLQLRVVHDVESFVIAELVHVGPGGKVNGELAAFEDSLVNQDLQRAHRRPRINVPVKYESADAVGNGCQVRQRQHLHAKEMQKGMQQQTVGS